MKRIIQKPIGVSAVVGDLSAPLMEYVEYPHESTLLEEVASHAINKRLTLKKRQVYELMGQQYQLRFGPSNPHKASLIQSSYISDDMFVTATNAEDIERTILKKMVEGVIVQALEAVDKVHNLEGSFWNRLRYLFTKKLTSKS